jgi:hypothetical protein
MEWTISGTVEIMVVVPVVVPVQEQMPEVE